MATISIERPLQISTSEFDGTIATGFLVENTNMYYLPVTLTNFTAPDLALTLVNGTTGQSTLTAVAPTTGTPGVFDNVRVGDIISATSVGTITTNSTVTITAYTTSGLYYVVYRETYDSTNLGVSSGDTITGTGIPSNTLVQKIDYNSRRIFLTNACTASGEVTLTIQPVTRVTAVRTSTATTNANQIDFDSVVGTSIINSNVTIKVGAREAVHSVIRLQPISNTTGSRANFTIAVAYLDGTGVIGSASGLNNINILTLGYITLGTYGFDLNTFLVNARLPQPTSV